MNVSEDRASFTFPPPAAWLPPSGSQNVALDTRCDAPSVPAPVIVLDNGAPYAPGQSIFTGDVLQLAVTPVSHCVSNPAWSYAWNVTTGGTTTNFGGNSATAVYIVNGSNTTYTFSVAVSDQSGQSTVSSETSVFVMPPP